MRDPEIRMALHTRLAMREAGKSDVRIVDEMAVMSGECRVDVAVINGRLEGFEIKSERDSLARLPRQAAAYGLVFDRMTVLCAERHLEHITSTVPTWWGIEIASQGDDEIRLRRVRSAKANRNIEPKAIAQLLWHAEALEALEALGIAKGVRSKPRDVLWTALAESMTTRDLRRLVRERLRARADWLARGPRHKDDAECRLRAR